MRKSGGMRRRVENMVLCAWNCAKLEADYRWRLHVGKLNSRSEFLCGKSWINVSAMPSGFCGGFALWGPRYLQKVGHDFIPLYISMNVWFYMSMEFILFGSIWIYIWFSITMTFFIKKFKKSLYCYVLTHLCHKRAIVHSSHQHLY